MKLECMFKEKEFTNEKGESMKYYVLETQIADGSVIQIPVKGDKAKILIMSIALQKKGN